MTEPSKHAEPLTEEAALREIEALVYAAPGHAVPHPGAEAEAVPDLEAVARDLGISVEALRAIRETALG